MHWSVMPMIAEGTEVACCGPKTWHCIKCRHRFYHSYRRVECHTKCLNTDTHLCVPAGYIFVFAHEEKELEQ
jgi:hypothetical protein